MFPDLLDRRGRSTAGGDALDKEDTHAQNETMESQLQDRIRDDQTSDNHSDTKTTVSRKSSKADDADTALSRACLEGALRVRPHKVLVSPS